MTVKNLLLGYLRRRRQVIIGLQFSVLGNESHIVQSLPQEWHLIVNLGTILVKKNTHGMSFITLLLYSFAF